jgi:orotidine-5'-phosphate decarboxylase
VSNAPLETLVQEQQALIAALDNDDVTAIARHTDTVQDAILRIRALNPRFAGTEAKRLIDESITLADAARVRINVLADLTSRKLTRLAATTGKGNANPTYGRNGRLAR